MTVCSTCKHANYCEIVAGGYSSQVKSCRDYRKGETTNEEWFCELSTEEKAKVLYNFFMARTFCHICPENNVCDIGYKCKYSDGKKIEDWVKWLKKPHKE